MRIILLLLLCGHAMADVLDIRVIAEAPKYRDMQLSPTGEYFAAVMPVQGEERVVILDRVNSKVLAVKGFMGTEVVDEIHWAKSDRLLVTNAVKQGRLDYRVNTGELFAMNVDGRAARAIFGYRVHSDSQMGHIKKAQPTDGWHRLIHDLPQDKDDILISVHRWSAGVDGALPEIQQLNTRNGKMRSIGRGPIHDGVILADHSGTPVFCIGEAKDGVYRVYRFVQNAWQELKYNTDHVEIEPVGFSADNKKIYWLKEQQGALTALYRFDTESEQEEQIYAPSRMDLRAGHIQWNSEHTAPLWLQTLQENGERYHYLEPAHPLAKLHRSLVKQFASLVTITSMTRDGTFAIAMAHGDKEPGAFYLIDVAKKQAGLIALQYENIEPKQLSAMVEHDITARDGLPLQVLLSLPQDTTPKNLPAVVLVHGGPYWVRDIWGFDKEAQLLTSRGYAVLQVNFRGSGGFGKSFELAGYRQWGRKMQDDVTDATKWLIDKGFADAKRLCIMGGSYGGYSAMMGLIREPDLYQCGITEAGIADLTLMHEEGDIPERKTGRIYLSKAIGNDETELKQNSPLHNVEKIKGPVLIMHGGKDERVPIVHAERLEAALKQQNKVVESLYFEYEGHGFVVPEHEVARYEKVLAFLQQHIGGKTESAP